MQRAALTVRDSRRCANTSRARRACPHLSQRVCSRHALAPDVRSPSVRSNAHRLLSPLILQAYKKLAIKYHPDKNPENKELAEENFKKVSEAYECLSSEEKRRTYDQFGKQGLNGAGGGGDGFSNERAEEIFSQFFGGQDPFSVLFGEMGGMGGGRGGGGGRMPGGAQFQFCSTGGPSGMGGMPPGMGGMGGMGGGMPEMMAQMMGGASHTLSSFRSSHAPFSPPSCHTRFPHPISTPDTSPPPYSSLQGWVEVAWAACPG